MKHKPFFTIYRILSFTLIMVFLCTTLSGCSHRKTFSEFTQALFLDEITSNTINLHYSIENPNAYGIRDYDISLGDFSKKARSNAKSSLLNMKSELLSYSYFSLTTEEQLTYDILNDYLDTQLALCEYELYQEPLSGSGGVQMNLPILFAEYEFNTEQDVKDYLELIALTDEYFKQIIDFEKEKAASGLFMSDAQCLTVIESCEAFLCNIENHYLKSTFESRLMELGLSDRKITSYVSKNDKILKEQLFPAYENLINELNMLLGTGSNDGGLCHFPYGKEYYELLVYESTGCNDSIDEIFDRITSQRTMDLIVCADLQSKDSSIIDQCTYLEWEMENSYVMLDLLQESILEEFPKAPSCEYEINYVEKSLEEYLAPAFYIVAPVDNYTENVIYINEAYITNDIYCFTTLAHEGYPGHLYQTVMTYEYYIPELRTLLDYSGYVEGWATYIEMMSYYYAGLPDDVATMLSYNQSATLSLYASSDIGLHYYGWTKDDMYRFWRSYGITNTDIVDKITQLILSEPGNYLKYYVGYLEFLELKDFARETLGLEFNLIDFHGTILDIGPAPFWIIEKYFTKYYSSFHT